MIFAGGNQRAIAYGKLNLPMVHTVAVRPGETNTIDVVPGKTLKTLTKPHSDQGYFGSSGTNMRLTQGSNTFSGFVFNVRYSFEGPCTLQLSVTNTAITAAVMCYTFVEDFVEFPELGYLRTPAGDFEVVLEKTTNLTNWVPVLSHNTTSDQRAFYRLRISK